MRDNFLPEVLNSIKEYAKEKSNEEICGIITMSGESQEFIRCENIASDTRIFFLLDPSVYVDYDVNVVVHSHCIGPARPSSLDKKCADEIELPFLIYSTIDNDFCLYNNKSVISFKV